MSDADAQHAITNTEFSEKLRNAGKYVAIIPTQSWCHQWHAIRSWFEQSKSAAKEVVVFYYEYDTTDLFDPFREFKESHWKNDQVPYIRYYRDGICVHESNYCSEDDFYRSFDA